MRGQELCVRWKVLSALNSYLELDEIVTCYESLLMFILGFGATLALSGFVDLNYRLELS
jgi:hypothetical protein